MEEENKSTVKQRLKDFIATQGISEREFCRKLGVSSAYVESIKKSISPKVMQTISIQYPELNPLWLLMGTGEMTKKEEKEGSGLLPSEMLAELLAEARQERARLLAIVESQQRTIEGLTEEIKKVSARAVAAAGCAAVG